MYNLDNLVNQYQHVILLTIEVGTQYRVQMVQISLDDGIGGGPGRQAELGQTALLLGWTQGQGVRLRAWSLMVMVQLWF